MSAVGIRKRGERRFCPTRGCFCWSCMTRPSPACTKPFAGCRGPGSLVRTSHPRTGHRHGTLDSIDRSTGEIACNQERIYLYIYRPLISNVHLDRAAIAEARDLMVKLNNAWQSIIWAGTASLCPTCRWRQCPTGRRIGRSKGSSPLILPVLDARRGERLSSAISAEEETTKGSK